MESVPYYSGWKKRSVSGWVENVDEEGGKLKASSSLLSAYPSILQPQTPKEPMEFLARSWSLSSKEVTKALAQKQKHNQFFVERRNNSTNVRFPETVNVQQQQQQQTFHSKVVTNLVTVRRKGPIGKWFNTKELGSGNSSLKKKDRMRADNARIHAAVSVAALAAALAAVVATSENSSDGLGTKMGVVLASATEMLASHCIEIAELAGADHDRVASVVRSAVNIRTPGDLMTLTAAAATALRGEATLRSRLPKDARKNAAISPHDSRSMEEGQSPSAFRTDIEERGSTCKGELLQQTQKGVLQWKRASVYINKKFQVIIKLKSKHIGGAFTKNHKCAVYGVCDEDDEWPFRKEKETYDGDYFGLKTAQGFLEFKCNSKIHKQNWVSGIQNLFSQVRNIETTTNSIEFLNIN